MLIEEIIPKRPLPIHFELDMRPIDGIPQLICNPAFEGLEITHTRCPEDVTCKRCLRRIAKGLGMRKGGEK